ncbi:hypothetical protein BGZ65_011520, partial [Modicella reniformis]
LTFSGIAGRIGRSMQNLLCLLLEAGRPESETDSPQFETGQPVAARKAFGDANIRLCRTSTHLEVVELEGLLKEVLVGNCETEGLAETLLDPCHHAVSGPLALERVGRHLLEVLVELFRGLLSPRKLGLVFFVFLGALAAVEVDTTVSENEICRRPQKPCWDRSHQL